MNRPVALSIVCLIGYFLPFLISQEASNIIIHDHLDGNLAQQVVLATEGKTFSLNPNTRVESIMSGLPRSTYQPALNVRSLLFVLLPPFLAFLINFMLVHIIAFMGMYLLLRRHFLHNDSDLPVMAFTALCFALIPFYTGYGLSTAGTPLLLYAFMNLRANTGLKLSTFIIGVFSMYSAFVLVGVFALTCLSVWGLYEFYKERVWKRNFNKGLFLLFACYLVTNFQLIFQFFIGGSFVSHRTEFVADTFDFVGVVDHALDFFYNLHYHVSSPVGFTLVLSLTAVFLGISRQHGSTKTLVLLLLLNLVFAFVQSVASWEMLEGLWSAIPLTKQFQWNRFYYLCPLVWYLSLWFSLIIIKDSLQFLKYSNIILGILGCFQLFFIWKSNIEFRETSYNLFAEKKVGWSYKDFFDPQLFDEVKIFIDKPVKTYRVGSLGMHPAVAQVNGFRTVDGYMPNYPLEYKHQFRKIIANELEKPNGFKPYFDNWGSRCYFFSTELGYNFTVDKESNAKVNNLGYDFNEGPPVDYILSAAEIGNPVVCNLKHLKTFERVDSKWRIFLYQVKSNIVLNDANSVKVLATVQVLNDDMFQLFYQPMSAAGYDEEYSIRVNVKGRSEKQSLMFRIPDTVAIGKLRLDIGNNPEQKFIKIFDIQIIRGAKIVPIDLETLAHNPFINRTKDQINLITIDSRYDPYFEFDNSSIDMVNEIRNIKVDLDE